jgi:hypothetical protein
MKQSITNFYKTVTQNKPFFQWLDDNLLAIWTGFLLAFIPLWPKIPLFSPIEQYIVRVRLEDIFILIGFIIWIIYFLRGKVDWKKPIVYALLAYLAVGLASVLSAVFIIGTVPFEPLHLGKTLLHYFRNIQYFSLFFIAFSAVKSKTHIKIMLATICITLIAVSLYGYGQRNFYWPVYSTMNREFSKGVRLYLSEHARVQSTFAGHYDLGAYLVITLPILLAFGYQVRKLKWKIAFHGIHLIGLWLLVVSAARSSFAGYIVAVTLVTIIFAALKSTWRERILWGLSRYFVLGLLISYTFFTFGDDIYDRFLQVLKSYPEAHNTYHEINRRRIEFTDNFILIPLGVKDITLPKAQIPEGAISTDELDSVLVKSDTQPSTQRPSDVYVDIPDIVEVSTTSAEGVITTTYEERDRTYSDNALRYGLSLAIRLDTLWPQAIDGFNRNPLVGSGYGTLNKRGPSDFTEADSTDNNFLRTLGETGALGFLTFYGAIALAIGYAAKSLTSKDSVLKALAASYIAGTIGLLGNAVYIDVFAASKVAQVFWAVTGLLIAYYYLDQKQKSTQIAAQKSAEPIDSSKKRAKKGSKK